MACFRKFLVSAIAGLSAFRVAVAQFESFLPTCAEKCATTLTENSSCDLIDALCICRIEELWKKILCCAVETCNEFDAQSAILIAKSYCEGGGITVDTDTKDCSAINASVNSTKTEEMSSTKSPSATDQEATEDGSSATATRTAMETSTRQTDSSSDSSEPTAGSASSNDEKDDSNGGGNNTTPIGLGVGLGVGIPLTLGAIGYLAFLFWRTKRQNPKPAAPVAAGMTYDGAVKDLSSPGHEVAYVPPLTHELGYTPAPRFESGMEERQRQVGELP